jgi:hypothetical protein
MNFPLPNDYFLTYQSLSSFVRAYAEDYWSSLVSVTIDDAQRRMRRAGKRQTGVALDRECLVSEENLRLAVKNFLAENQRNLTADEVVFMDPIFRFAWAISTVLRPILQDQLVGRHS